MADTRRLRLLHLGAVDAHLPIPGITGSDRRSTHWALVLAREAMLVIAATFFLALTAQITIPLSPVPITGQTLGVLLVGALYGPRRGAVSVLAYLVEGAAGLPVFAGARAGVPVLLGPTGGYLVGFVPAAVIAGFARAGQPAIVRISLLILASVVVYVFGAPWLAAVRAMPLSTAVAAGVLPFLPGDVLKAGIAAGVLPAGALLLDPLQLLPRR